MRSRRWLIGRVCSSPSSLSLRAAVARLRPSGFGEIAFATREACRAVAGGASDGWWGKKDSHLRSHKTADLQSAPFATRDTPPFNSITNPTAVLAADEAMDDVKSGSRLANSRSARLWAKGDGKVNQGKPPKTGSE